MTRTKKILFTALFVILLVLVVYGVYIFGERNMEKESLTEYTSSEITETVEPQKTEKELAQEAEEARIQDIENQLVSGNYSPDLKVAFLTFDDGPNEYSNEVLDLLNQYGVKGTFFTNGKTGEEAENIYRRIVNEGHVLANHTYSHNYDYYNNQDLFLSDIERLNTYLTEVTGVEPLKVFRFPGGSTNTNQANVNLVVANGYSFFDWTSSAGDGGGVPLDASQTWSKIITETQDQNIAVILTHAESPGSVGTRGALPGVIEELTSQGYTFLTLDPAYHFAQFIEPTI